MVEVIHEALDKNIKALLFTPPTAKKVTQLPPPPTEVGGGGGFQPTPKAIESPSAPKSRRRKNPRDYELRSIARSAARKMEKYISQKGISQTDFAGHAQTTDKPRAVSRSTGKVRRDIFANIAKAAGTTKDDLLKKTREI